MEELLSVTICDPLDFDENIFLSWLKGLKSQEATEAHIAAVSDYWTQDMDNEGSNIFSVSQQRNSGLYDLLEHEILDHYKSYEFLEHYICQPWLLTNQIMIRIPDHIIQWVICQYYTLDSQVARTLLGKRLFKNRRELEDMADHCNIPLISVTRQFENLHRIYLTLEDLQFQANFMGFIETSYALPPSLSRKYACLLFLVAGRFDVNSKKRLQKLSCVELENCAAASMACLLPDLKTFLELKSGSFDEENLDVPTDAEIEHMSDNSNIEGLQEESVTSTSAATSDFLVSGYIFAGDTTNLDNGKSKSQKGMASDGINDVELTPQSGHVDRSKSAPTQPKSVGYATQKSPWLGIWKMLSHSTIYATEPDKQLLTHLRELRTLFTNDVCEVAIVHIKKILLMMSRGDVIIRKLDGKIKSILKSLTSICGHLSQSKEYRDIYDDILHIVGESLQETGLDRYEANRFLIACNSMIAGIKETLLRKMDRLENSKKQRKINTLEMDWIRFVLCCRICLWNMYDVLLS